MLLRLADFARTTTLLAFLFAVTNTMTLFIAQMADDLELLSRSFLFRASSGLVTNFATVIALVNTTIKWNTGIGKTSEIFRSILGPLGDKSGALRLVRKEIADGIFLVDFTLKVDVGPGVTMVFFLY